MRIASVAKIATIDQEKRSSSVLFTGDAQALKNSTESTALVEATGSATRIETSGQFQSSTHNNNANEASKDNVPFPPENSRGSFRTSPVSENVQSSFRGSPFSTQDNQDTGAQENRTFKRTRVMMLEPKYRDFIAINPTENIGAALFGKPFGRKIYIMSRRSYISWITFAAWAMSQLLALLMITEVIKPSYFPLLIGVPHLTLMRLAQHVKLTKRLFRSFEYAFVIFMIFLITATLADATSGDKRWATLVLLFFSLEFSVSLDSLFLPVWQRRLVTYSKLIQLLAVLAIIKEDLVVNFNNRTVTFAMIHGLTVELSSKLTLITSLFSLIFFILKASISVTLEPSALYIHKARLRSVKLDERSLPYHLPIGVRSFETVHKVHSTRVVPTGKVNSQRFKVRNTVAYLKPPHGHALHKSEMWIDPKLHDRVQAGKKLMVLMAQPSYLHPKEAQSSDTLVNALFGQRLGRMVWHVARGFSFTIVTMLIWTFGSISMTFLLVGTFPSTSSPLTLLTIPSVVTSLLLCNPKLLFEVFSMFEALYLLGQLLIWVLVMRTAIVDERRIGLAMTALNMAFVVVMDSAHAANTRFFVPGLFLVICFCIVYVVLHVTGYIAEACSIYMNNANFMTGVNNLVFADLRMLSITGFMTKNLFMKLRYPEYKAILKAKLVMQELSVEELKKVWADAHDYGITSNDYVLDKLVQTAATTIHHAPQIAVAQEAGRLTQQLNRVVSRTLRTIDVKVGQSAEMGDKSSPQLASPDSN